MSNGAEEKVIPNPSDRGRKVTDKWVKVTCQKSLRHDIKECRIGDFLKEKAMGAGASKTTMGNTGFMLKSDYEAGIFAPYGIDPKHIVSGENLVEKSLAKTNAELQARIAELEREAKAKQTPPTKEAKQTPPTKEAKQTPPTKDDEKAAKMAIVSAELNKGGENGTN